MATSDPTARILGPDGRPWHSDAPDGIKLPVVWTFGSLVNSYSKSYSWKWDEAYSQSQETALAMRRDCNLMGLLRERQLPTEQMRWHIEPEDKKDQRQVDECSFLEKVIARTPYFHNYKRACLEAIWYGRAGPQQALTKTKIEGEDAVYISNHVPINGDKIQFSWDGTPEIRLYMGATTQVQQAGGTVIFGDVGSVIKLDKPFWRSRFVIHRHDVVDSDFMEVFKAGAVNGIGVRSWIFWLNWMKLEVVSWLMDFMERTGLGLTIYYYDAASANGEQQARARAQQDGRNTVIIYPRNADGSDVGNGIERIETQTAGAGVIMEMVEKMFDTKIERFIIGQTMSSRQDGGGLGGSHAAKFQANTKYRIIKSDCDNLAETLTEQLVKVLQKLNPKTANSPYHYRWVFNVDEYDPEAKLNAAKIAYGMGVSFNEDELREPTGFSKPTEDDAVLKQADPMEMMEAESRLNPKPAPGQNGKANGKPKPSANGKGKRQDHSRNGNGVHHDRLGLQFYKDLHEEQKSFLDKVTDTLHAGEKRIERIVKKFLARVWGKTKRIIDAAFGRATAATPPMPGKPAEPQVTTTKKMPPATDEDVKAIAETVAENIDVPELKQELKPTLEKLHTSGVLIELDDNVRTRVGAYSGDQVWRNKFSGMRKKLPEELKTATSEYLNETFQQPWWDNLPGEVGTELAQTLRKGLHEGETIEGLIARLQNTFADLSSKRARLIARTEVCAALNAGLQSARVEQWRKGLVKGKQWQNLDHEKVRPTHLAADGQSVGVMDSFTVGGELCQYPGDQRLSAKERCNCFLPGTLIEGEYEAAMRAPYAGQAVEIVLRSGRNLSLTPNHPVLTTSGWIFAGQLNRGQKAISYRSQTNRFGVASANQINDVPTEIEKVFEPFMLGAVSGAGPAVKVRRPDVDDFNGDALFMDGDIQIVRANWVLLRDDVSRREQQVSNSAFEFVDEQPALASSVGSGGESFGRVLSPAPRIMGTSSLHLASDFTHRLPFNSLSFGLTANLDTGGKELSKNGASGETDFVGDLLERNAGVVFFDEIIQVRKFNFSGQVYCLQSENGMILSGGVVTSNCRCIARSIPVEAAKSREENVDLPLFNGSL